MEKFIGIIPARFKSTRFPGKPLVNIGGKPMIQRVYEQAKKIINDVVIATDDMKIRDAVENFGGQVVMTSELHNSGTDRCAEAYNIVTQSSGKEYAVILNIQGDEPFIQTEQIKTLLSCFDDSETQIATLVKAIDKNDIIFDPNKPKVILDKKNFALFFSRSPIPFIRGVEKENWQSSHTFFQHIGMYAYRKEILHEITKLPTGNLEKAESLEQLRWLENGYRIKAAITPFESFGIDTPEDLQMAITLGLVH